MSDKNYVKAKLKSGGCVFGTWSVLGSPSAANVISRADMDFIIIDMEHGRMSFETAEQLIYCSESSTCTPIIRLGQKDEPTILRALETGACGLMTSHVATAKEAEKVVRGALYPPEGRRGLSPFTRIHGYSGKDISAKLRKANAEMFVGVLVEGEEGVSNLEAIAKVPGLDMIYLGIYDISMTMGVPGELTHPKVVKFVKDSVKIIESSGLAAGSVAPDRDYIQFLFEAGVRFIAYHVDCAVLKEGFLQARSWFRELEEKQ